MIAYLFLGAAIVAEVTGTVALRLSEGFTRLVPSVVVVLGYGATFLLLSQTLVRGVPLGVAYGIWSACGVALVALVGVGFLGESLSWVQVGGIVLVIGGVVALEAGGRH